MILKISYRTEQRGARNSASELMGGRGGAGASRAWDSENAYGDSSMICYKPV